MTASKHIPVCLSGILISLCHVPAFPQSEKNSAGIAAGIGNYEYLHAGVNLPVHHRGAYIETAIGIKPWNISSATYAMFYLSLGIPFLKERTGVRFIEPFFQLKLLPWYFNNQFNTFVMLGAGPEFRLVHNLNSRLQLLGSGGIIYNALLHYERKTNEEVGWPKEWQPLFRLQLCYRIK